MEDEWIIADHVAELALEAGATSIATAETQAEAVRVAFDRRPDLILSDVKLAEGTGPLAVEAILAAHGPTPVIFITGSPAECSPCLPPAEVLAKPIVRAAVIEAFQRLAPR